MGCLGIYRLRRHDRVITFLATTNPIATLEGRDMRILDVTTRIQNYPSAPLPCVGWKMANGRGTSIVYRVF